MDQIQRIEAEAFTILDLHLRNVLAMSESDLVEQIVIGPQSLCEAVCIELGTNIHQFIMLNDKQFKQGCSFVEGIIERDRTSLTADVAGVVGSMINPLGKFVRDSVGAQLADDPIYIELRNMYQTFGMDIVLGIFSELLNRGYEPELLIVAMAKWREGLGYVDGFNSEVDRNLREGIISGKNNSAEAKKAEIAGSVGGALMGAKVGAVMGSIVSGPGTVVGAAAGASIGKHFGAKEFNKCAQNQAVSEVINHVSNKVYDAGNDVTLVANEAANSVRKKFSKFWA
ncbi:glycine zipper family protein [Shewanella fidelis]|uniref:glycine zipper family protein n=1 Tax=Shewanella fidelis TaxID=173509 RepID=UPI000491459E|nr:glycine zipper family protein [Shewanella fidelis]